MEPIISPWLIYLAGVAGSFNVIVVTAFVISLVGTCIFAIVYVVAKSDGRDQDAERGIGGALRALLFILVASSLAGIFVPSRSDVYQMIAASFVTPDNVVVARDETLKLIGMIANAIGR